MDDASESRSTSALWVAIMSVAAMVVTGALYAYSGVTGTHIAFLLCQVVVISIVIWQACDPFAEAAQWIGNRFHIPGSVRGATLDAVASSMPEFFSGIFFVVVAMSAAGGSREELARASSDGYGPTVATCAGSAIYNMILIPAICALVISFVRKSRPTIDVGRRVIMRDGVWFLCCELLLIVFLFQSSMTWWMAVVFLLVYIVYIRFLLTDARRFQRAVLEIRKALGSQAATASLDRITEVLQRAGMNPSHSMAVEAHNRLFTGNVVDDDEESIEYAQFAFGFFRIHLNTVSVWVVVAVATLIAAVSCYWLVEVTRATSTALNVPLFFVAVILAAAASSVPDTFLSIGAARRGDDDGAVSNAFGSNIFDICVCLSIPLLVCTYMNGWNPISLTHNGEPMQGLVGIRVLLCVLTVVTLLIMWHKHQLTRLKAIVLCLLYALFVAYAVAGSLGYTLGRVFS